MPYMREHPEHPGVKESYRISRINIDLQGDTRFVYVEVRGARIDDKTGELQPSTAAVRIDGDDLSAMARRPTTGATLYEEIKDAIYNKLVDMKVLPPEADGWEVD